MKDAPVTASVIEEGMALYAYGRPDTLVVASDGVLMTYRCVGVGAPVTCSVEEFLVVPRYTTPTAAVNAEIRRRRRGLWELENATGCHSPICAVMRDLLALNAIVREREEPYRHRMAPADWHRYRCTVALNTGDHDGHTQYIIANATRGDLVIVPYGSHTTQYEKCPATCMTAREFRITQNNYRNVYVDGPGLVFAQFKGGRGFLYRTLYRDYVEGQTLILMG